MLVLGARELENDSVAARLHGKGNVGVKPCSEAVNDFIAAIEDRQS
jgi:threonyl-tRNA synthetase